MFDKLFAIAMVVDSDFKDKYKPLMNEAIENARQEMHVGAPEQVGQIVIYQWFDDDELYKEYNNLLVDILDADINDRLMEVLKDE